jgi:hypothetical protein
MRRPLRSLLVLLTLSFAAFAVGESLRKGEEALIQRQYAAAVEHLQRALGEETAGDRDRVLLLLGRAHWLAGQHEQAVAAYDRLLAEHPQSALRDKARFQQAQAHAAAGRFREAALAYRGEIERLTGPERKEEIAATYLGLAEKALAQEKPDHARAVAFFDLALDLGLSDGKARAVRLRAAEARLGQGDAKDAIARFSPLVDVLTREQGKLAAMLGLGRAQLAAGDRGSARRILRDLIAAAPDAPEAADAAYEVVRTHGVPEPDPGELDRAVGALRFLGKRYPQHDKAKIALFLEAQCYRHAGRSDASLQALRQFLEERSDETLAEVATARAMVGDVLLAQQKLDEAIAAWQSYLQAHPSHGEWERVQRAIVDAEFTRALGEYESGKERFGEARKLFEAFAAAHPLDERNPQILLLLGEMLLHEEKYSEARAAYGRCVSKYPGKEASSLAQLRVGEIYESKTFHYLEALRAYRLVTWGSQAAVAARRIARLERKHLALFTPRSFRTGEKALIELTSRNIEKVRVRVFHLEMETYFRAMHTAGEVEKLDIEVIEPDAVFESAVEDYQKHRETKREVEIGAGKPGAYVVKVDDRELEATTLVVVTDVGLIAKTSRHECFVFTQNLEKARVEAGVKVVLSDGSKAIAEGLTDASGVWRYRGKELQNLAQLRVFAVDASGSGAAALDLSGLGYSQGLAAKGYLFTDRPAYQPGQLVHVKGIVREARDGLYRLPEGGYRLQVASPAGRLIVQRPVSFTEFGTFAVDCALPPQAELGEWSVRVEKEPFGGTVFTGNFVVARYERPRLQLAAEANRAVVYRGERIEGTLRLTYFFGQPAIDKPVVCRMQMPDGALVEHRARTNAAGEVPFSFATDAFAEEAMAVVEAQVVEENVVTRLVVPVVTTEFEPKLETVRDVYLAGEPFDVTVELRDRGGNPLARSGTLRLLRLEPPRQRPQLGAGEVEVAAAEFTTDAKTGKAMLRLRADKGGDHVVRVAATDRFGTSLTEALAVRISGDDDEVKLRLLSDRQRYEVGETVKVQVVNRAGPRLVLRTVQGDGILAYESGVLPAGESTLEFRLEPLHAPNFALALAMIDGKELRLAEREFRVDRDLRVNVKTAQPTARPGGKVAVEVEARDPQGRPVQAELALALVDQALLSVHPDAVPPIGAFFWGTLRETEFRTTSSCTWSYAGASRAVSAALVAEEERAKAAERPAEEEPVVVGSDEFLLGADMSRFDSAVRDRALRVQTEGRQEAFVGFNQAVGLGGGAGGKFGGRRGGAWATLGEEFQGPGDVVANLQSESAFELAALARATDEPRADFSETGGWLSSVITDAQGRATVELALPDSTTAWRIKARGTTRDTWVGEGEATLRTSKELQAELVAPGALTEGDRVSVTARAHNLSDTARGIDLALRASGAGEPQSFTQRVEVQAQREAEAAFDLTAGRPGELVLEVEAAGGERRDVLRQPIPVRPFGIEVRDGRSGRTDQEARLRLSLPAGREYASLAMSVDIGPDAGRDLVAAALGIGYRPWNCTKLDQTNLAVASRGLAALTVLGYLQGTGRSTPADVARLRGVASACLARLVSAQAADGGIGWIGDKSGDLRTTSEAVRFFLLARRLGHSEAVPPLDTAVNWLLAAMRNARGIDRARAAHALALAERIDFAELNALHRGRASMALDELALLALAWQHGNRAGLVGEVLEVLRPKLMLGDVAHAAEIEAVALAARSLAQAGASDPLARQAVQWLDGKRVGVSWGTPSATAAALEALVVAGGTELARGSTAEVEITVNGRQLATVPTTWQAASAHFDVPADWLQERDNAVVIRVAGRGVTHYSAVLTGFARDMKEEDAASSLLRLRRYYEPAYLRHAGKVLTPGFGVLQGRIKGFRNELQKLEAGGSGRVTLWYALHDAARKTMPPLIVEEPIPAGCSVPRDSVRGSFDHVVMEPDRMTFYYREGRDSDSITYELQARFPGTYRALPTRIVGALRPDLLAHGAVSELTVLAAGSSERDPYRMTPDELYQLGKALFEEDRLAEAGAHLDQLLREWPNDECQIRGDVAKEVARMMLFVAIAANDGKSIVRFFEELKDRSPDLVIPFDKILAVGKAYLDIGEFERALMVFRGTADASFLKEAAVATTLEQMGEVKTSIAFLRDLLRAYPDLNTMRVSLYSIGQKLAALAAAMPDGAPVDARVGRSEDLRRLAVAIFRQFLVLYPEDPLAEEVSFAWATTHVEAGELQPALAVAEAALARYPQSSFEDELLYTIGYVQFALGRHEAAFATLERVATGAFAQPGGSRGPSENRDHAVYLQGQIHHALGKPADALLAYEKVKERFSDAEEASDYFLRKRLSLPEVTTFALDAAVRLPLTYRNIARIDAKVYRVDLMRLYLLEKSLNDIRGVRLHGIRPYAEFAVELGEGRDYRAMEKTLELSLAEPGAYLVVARGDSLLATGMVLRSNLRIDAQELLDVGRIRVNVKSGDTYLARAHVKVVGSGDQAFRSGDTDLRGIFVGDDLVGRATVIVKHDDQYAFFRGTGIHQPERFQPPPPPEADRRLDENKQNYKGQRFEGWENNLRFNAGNRAKQVEWLEQEVMRKQQRGVEVYRTK